MNDEKTLDALQAIAIYFLLRISEEHEEPTKFDLPLVETMMVCFVALSPSFFSKTSD